MSNGFYGSLSKLQKINFQFDRVFPNRATMDAEASTTALDLNGSQLDCVLNGRYVLVDYNEGETVDISLKLGYKQDGTIYAAYNVPFKDKNALNENDSVIVIGEFDADGKYTKYNEEEIWVYKGNDTFEQRTDLNTEISNGDNSIYEHNLIIDNTLYPNAGRGWDSTVWQKTYQNGKSVYIMIAELNAISPTLSVAPDPPSIDGMPSSAYFSDSTPNFYRLHIGSNWGFRIKGASPLSGYVYNPNTGNSHEIQYSIDEQEYPSDVKGVLRKIDSGLDDYPLAIYFNKRGFNRFLSSADGYAYVNKKIAELEAKRDSELNESNRNKIIVELERWQSFKNSVNNKGRDFVDLTPTGRSGKFYSNVLANGDSDVSMDMQELSVMLPSIGETMSDIWDIVYGKERSKDSNNFSMYYHNLENENAEKIIENFSSDDKKIRNTDIYWNSTNGVRAHSNYLKATSGSNQYDSSAWETLGGTINSVHDLVGMIIRDYSNLSLTEGVDQWDPTKIYYINNEYYIKNKEYVWTKYSDQSASHLIYNTISPVNMVGYGYRGGAAAPIDLYRISQEQYPVIEDQNVSDNLSEYDNFKGKSYQNYIKVKGPDDIIEGAVYGTIEVTNPTEWTTPTPTSGLNYYYYLSGADVVYKKESSSTTWDKGVYYAFTNAELSNAELINTYFYEPGKFYIENKTTHELREALSDSLAELLSETNTQLTDWIFYPKNQYRLGPPEDDIVLLPVYKKDANGNYIFELSYNSIDTVSNYNYNSDTKVLTFTVQTRNTSNVTTITVATEFINGIKSIVVDENGNVKGYYSRLYQVIEDGKYYTPADVALNGYSYYYENDKTVPQYKIDHYKKVPAPYTVITPTQSGAQPANVIDFEEGTYFHSSTSDLSEFLLVSKDSFGLDAAEHSTITNDGHGFYKLSFNAAHRIYVRQVGGGYYETAEGDYIRYYAPHLEDPNNPVGSKIVTFTKLPGNYSVFRSGEFYEDADLTVKAIDYSPTKTYYERIGNIVGDSEPDWPDGMEWNQAEIPAGLQLGSISKVWKPKKIVGFAKDLGTMHGLILQVTHLLQSGNKYTRDSSTIQGVLNQCHDVLFKLEDRGYAYGSISIEDKNKNTQTLTAQNSNAAIKLKSATNSIELSLDENDDINIDLAESYRKYVVPSGNENSSSLTFKVGNTDSATITSNATSTNLVGNAFNVQIQSNSSVAQEELYSNGTLTIKLNLSNQSLIITDSNGLVGRVRGITILTAPESGAVSTYDYTWEQDGSIATYTIDLNAERGIANKLYLSDVKWSISIDGEEVISLRQGPLISNNNNAIQIGTNGVVTMGKVPTYNALPLAYSETTSPISFKWDQAEQKFIVYSNNAPILEIRKQED